MARRKPKGQAPPGAARTPKAQPPVSTANETPHFCFRYADIATKHEWKFAPSGEDAVELFEFLRKMAGLKWSEIESQRTGGFRRHRKHHSQPISSISTEAQNDIRRAKLDEVFGDELFRFRLSGGKRLWGFRSGRVFHVVWWDPGHKVYETEPN